MLKNKNILIFDPLLLTYPYTLNLSNSLSKFNKVSLLTNKRVIPKYLNKHLDEIKLVHSHNFDNKKKIVKFFLLILTYFKFHKLCKKNDVIIFQMSPFTLFDYIILKFSKINNKSILNLHNSKPFHGEKKILQTLIYKKYLKSFNYFIVHSERTKRFLKIVFKKKNIFYFNLPYDSITNKFEVKKNIKQKYILFIGNIKYYKGLDLLIKAFSELDENVKCSFKLLIVGKNKFKLKIKDKNIKIINKYVDDKYVNFFINNCHLIILPYRDIDGSGILSLAINYEIPVITSNLLGFKEILTSYEEDDFFISDSVESLKEKLSNIMSDKNNLDKLKFKIKETKMKMNNWDSVSENLIKSNFFQNHQQVFVNQMN